MSELPRLTSALADHYRIEREIGAGGMATVYLAHDLKHDRDVAIKVLHPDLGAALGAERFLSEIKTTAKLQHPHILPLLDSGDADGLLYYVMPLVEGETLRARLERERQLAIDASLRIATEVAGALDYAHRHGVIHRDIKPENILLHDGRAVVADFGIALAVSAASGSRMTQTGLSLGTPQYMSPEQAMGEKQIDARADIYALGAVLYEMLTGEPPFSGATVQAIVAKVLTEKPMSPTAVRDTIPVHVEATLFKALAKLPADRFASAAEFATALARPEATAGFTNARAAGASATRSRVASPLLAWSVAGVSLALAAWGWARASRGPADPPPVVRALVPIVSGTAPTVVGVGNIIAITNDGSRIAFSGMDSTHVARIFVQSLGAPTLQAVPGSNFAVTPFFSPDGQSIGFSASGRLWTVSLAGGKPTPLAPVTASRGATWTPDGWIVYAHNRGLYRVRASGGAPEELAIPPSAGGAYRSPSIASDGKTVLFDILGDSADGLAALSLADRRVKYLGIAGVRPTLITGGVLAYSSFDGTIWAVAFDVGRLRKTGEPRIVAEGVSIGGFTSPRLAVALNGTLAFIPGGGGSDRDLVLVDRTGRARVVGPDKRGYRFPRFSPDGTKLAFGVMASGPGTGDIWALTLATGSMLRLTTDSNNYQPNWDPDGRSVIHIKRVVGSTGSVYRTSLDGTTPPVKVLGRPLNIWEAEITRDRRTLVFREDGSASQRDIYAMPLDSPSVVRPILASNFDERGFAVSPDGKWLAYTSDESGSQEIFLRRLESNSPRWPVTRRSGSEPRWARTGELFFRSRDSVFVTKVDLGAEPHIGEPQGLFAGPYDASNYEPLWDVSADGKTFAMVRVPGGVDLQVVVLVNWLERWRANAR